MWQFAGNYNNYGSWIIIKNVKLVVSHYYHFDFLLFLIFVSFVLPLFLLFGTLDTIRESGANYLAPYISSLIPKKVLNAARNQHRKNSAVDNLGDAVFKNIPSAPLNLKAAIVATRFITLSWSMPSSPNGELSGYSVFYKEFGSDR